VNFYKQKKDDKIQYVPVLCDLGFCTLAFQLSCLQDDKYRCQECLIGHAYVATEVIRDRDIQIKGGTFLYLENET